MVQADRIKLKNARANVSQVKVRRNTNENAITLIIDHAK